MVPGQKTGRRVFDRAPGVRVQDEGVGPVAERQNVGQDRAPVTLFAVTHDPDRAGPAGRPEVHGPGAPQVPIADVLALDPDAELVEVGRGGQGRLDEGARDAGHAVRGHPRPARVEALGEVIANDRRGAGDVGGRVGRAEVPLVQLRVDRRQVVVVVAAEDRHPRGQRLHRASRDRPADQVELRRRDDRRHAQRLRGRRTARRVVGDRPLAVGRSEIGPAVAGRAADRDDVLGGGRRGDLNRLRRQRVAVGVDVVVGRAAEQVGDDAMRQAQTVTADHEAVVPHRHHQHEVLVVVQERVDVGRLLRVGPVARQVQLVREVVRRTEGVDRQVDLLAAAGDPGAGAGAAALRAEKQVQPRGQVARVDLAALLDQRVDAAAGRVRHVLHDDPRAARDPVHVGVAGLPRPADPAPRGEKA